MVYVIQMIGTNFIKIGYTYYSPRQRLDQLQTGAPLALKILAVLDGDENLEHKLHCNYQQFKTNGGKEWFEMSQEVVEDLLSKYPQIDKINLLPTTNEEKRERHRKCVPSKERNKNV